VVSVGHEFGLSVVHCSDVAFPRASYESAELNVQPPTLGESVERACVNFPIGWLSLSASSIVAHVVVRLDVDPVVDAGGEPSTGSGIETVVHSSVIDGRSNVHFVSLVSVDARASFGCQMLLV
jgi:hypothetical protein